MADLGLQVYRFSIAWSRLFPDGRGRLNKAGLDYYSRLVDKLIERGVTPMATLYHWDLPQALQDSQGGWVSRDTADHFADYAAAAFEGLGDRVPRWITLNEPWVSAFVGHLEGRHAPGVRDLNSALRAGHHLLRGHGLAVDAYRASGLKGEIGITLNLNPVHGATERPEDERAAVLFDGHLNRWFLHPVFRGSYPVDLLDHYAILGADLRFIRSGDLAAMARPIDFLGVNYYFRNSVRATSSGLRFSAERFMEGEARTSLGWGIDPTGLRDLLTRLREDYPPIATWITENGCAIDDVVEADGEVRDPRRIDYLRGHIKAVEDAIADGSDMRGYLVWSLLDNFEWSAGYRPRFGVVHVDYATQRRTPKSSARWLTGVIAGNGPGL
jgi:beta-glucosidase